MDTTYDALGRVAAVSNPYRPGDAVNWTRYGYDSLGRATQVQQADNSTATTSYSGNTVTVTDEANKQKQYRYNGLGQLTGVVEDPNGLNYMTSYGYDALGNLTSVGQGAQTRAFVYDGLSRLTSATNPESGATTYAYDAAGNLYTKTDARNITTSYRYDAGNRLVSKTYSDGTPALTFQYDDPNVPNAKGRLTAAFSADSGTNYTAYDALGRVLGSTQGTAGQIYAFTYTYNLAGALTSETYPSGRVVATCYDAASRVSQVSGRLAGAPDCTNPQPSSTQTNYVTGFSYWPHGAPAQYLYGNTVGFRSSSNARLQPTTLTHALNNQDGSILLRLSPNWGTANNNGNLLSVLEENGGAGYPQFLSFTQGFTYDGVNRLRTALETDSSGATTWARGFFYDAYGNVAGDPNAQGFGLSPLTPLSGSINAANNRLGSASYDAAGNQTSVGAGIALTYDAENRQATSGDAASQLGVSYLYDALGQRVAKLGSDGSQQIYVYDAFGLLAAEYATTPPSAPCQTCYLSYDHLGSLRLVTDQTGAVVARHDYLPFGEEIYAGEAGRDNSFGAMDSTRQRFTGQARDGETTPNLDYFQARYYSGEQGRFLSPDPANAGADLYNPQSWNAYAYVNNSPLIYTDPSGTNLADWFSGIWNTISGWFGGGGDGLTRCISFGGDGSCGGESEGGPSEGEGGWLGGGVLFTATGLGHADVPTASTPPTQKLQPQAPPKNQTRPCQNVDPTKLDFTTPRYYGSEGRTIPPYQHILERHVLPNSKPGTTRYVFGSDLTGVHNPAQTMSAVIRLDQLTFDRGAATVQGNGNIQFLYTVPPIKVDTGFGILTLKGIGQTLSGGWLNTNGLVVSGNCTGVVTSYPTAP